MDDLRRIAGEHRICGPKYEGCYSHRHVPHCRADGMAWPCDVEMMRSLIDTPYPEDDIKDERNRILAAVKALDWLGCGGWGCATNMGDTYEAVIAVIKGETP